MMKMTKKASFFSPFVSVMAILGIIVVLFILHHEATTIDPEIGERQFNIFLAYESVENARTYAEHSAKFSLDRAVKNMLERGSLDDCLEYLEFDVINNKGSRCEREFKEQLLDEWDVIFDETLGDARGSFTEQGTIRITTENSKLEEEDEKLFVNSTITIEYTERSGGSQLHHNIKFNIRQQAEYNVFSMIDNIQQTLSNQAKREMLRREGAVVELSDGLEIKAGSCFAEIDERQGDEREKFYQFADAFFHCTNQSGNTRCHPYPLRELPEQHTVSIDKQRRGGVNVEDKGLDETLAFKVKGLETIEPFICKEGRSNCEGQYRREGRLLITERNVCGTNLASDDEHCGACGKDLSRKRECRGGRGVCETDSPYTAQCEEGENGACVKTRVSGCEEKECSVNDGRCERRVIDSCSGTDCKKRDGKCCSEKCMIVKGGGEGEEVDEREICKEACGVSGGCRTNYKKTTNGCEEKRECVKYEQCDVSSCTFKNEPSQEKEDRRLKENEYPETQFFHLFSINKIEVKSNIVNGKVNRNIRNDCTGFRIEIDGDMWDDCTSDNKLQFIKYNGGVRLMPTLNSDDKNERLLENYYERPNLLRNTADLYNLAEPRERKYYRLCAETTEKHIGLNEEEKRELTVIRYQFAAELS